MDKEYYDTLPEKLTGEYIDLWLSYKNKNKKYPCNSVEIGNIVNITARMEDGSDERVNGMVVSEGHVAGYFYVSYADKTSARAVGITLNYNNVVDKTHWDLNKYAKEKIYGYIKHEKFQFAHRDFTELLFGKRDVKKIKSVPIDQHFIEVLKRHNICPSEFGLAESDKCGNKSYECENCYNIALRGV